MAGSSTRLGSSPAAQLRGELVRLARIDSAPADLWITFAGSPSPARSPTRVQRTRQGRECGSATIDRGWPSRAHSRAEMRPLARVHVGLCGLADSEGRARAVLAVFACAKTARADSLRRHASRGGLFVPIDLLCSTRDPQLRGRLRRPTCLAIRRAARPVSGRSCPSRGTPDVEGIGKGAHSY